MEETTTTYEKCEENPEKVISTAWYPCPPPSEIVMNEKAIEKPIEATPSDDHPIWQKIKYTNCNFWSPNISKARKEAARRYRVPGVEVRDLPVNHFLHGEQGLYAAKKFEKFDIIGEYTGRIVGNEVLFGHYLAALEDCPQEEGLGVDAGKCGNEIRFINSYLNVAFSPNVTLRTTYINTYPHLLVVCTQDIDIGDEILLDYGAAYNELYLKPKVKHVVSPIGQDVILAELPKLDLEDSSSDADEAEINV